MLMQSHPPSLRPGLSIHQKDRKKAGDLHPLFYLKFILYSYSTGGRSQFRIG